MFFTELLKFLIVFLLPLLLLGLFHAGAGGKITGGGTDLHVTDWEINVVSRQAEVTNSGSSGVAQWQHLLTEGTWRANLPWDSTIIPGVDVAAFLPGASATVTLVVGDSGKLFSFSSLTESLQVISNSQNDIVRAVIAGKVNGTITHPVT